ncbi:PDZ domain-containing protein [Streptomyces spongiae]|uniref:PDZ domain-containing protein n=1 Tax=Streptomyces spongiae TaxID=565072 RepID=A0A5N8XQ51_9ACTN|nr:PDZ domain-containing protein [Streptomyces spongiae]MPY61620.1 PDZ domain-containing protein [Streptomyces spongiae]
MEQTVLRPKPMPGQEPGGADPIDASGPTRRPHAAPRRGKRLTTSLLTVLAATVLVLTGVGLGTVCATVNGMSRPAEPRQTAGVPGESGRQVGAPPRPGSSTLLSGAAEPVRQQGGSATTTVGTPVRTTLGVEVVDSSGSAGALVVGVHVPGPAYTAGLVRGDVLHAFGSTRVAGAADLARAVASATPGRPVRLAVRHANGTRKVLTTVPGVVT